MINHVPKIRERDSSAPSKVGERHPYRSGLLQLNSNLLSTRIEKEQRELTSLAPGISKIERGLSSLIYVA